VFTGAAAQKLKELECTVAEIQNSSLRYQPDYVRLLSLLSKSVSLTKMMTAALHILSFINAEQPVSVAEIQSVADSSLLRSAAEWVEHGLSSWHVMSTKPGTPGVPKPSTNWFEVQTRSPVSEEQREASTSLTSLLSTTSNVDQKIRLCAVLLHPEKRLLPFRDIIARLKCTSADVLRACTDIARNQPDRFEIPLKSNCRPRKVLTRLFVQQNADNEPESEGDTQGSERGSTQRNNLNPSSSSLTICVPGSSPSPVAAVTARVQGTDADELQHEIGETLDPSPLPFV
jgi:hypothetical protein